MNLDGVNHSIIAELIEEILNLGDALTDRSSLAKMRDCHPLNIFTISNSLKIFQKLEKDTFLFFILFSIWNECVLNMAFSIKLRIFLFEIILRIFIKVENYITNNTLGKFVGFKKSESKPFVFFVNPNKIKRVILTMLGQIAILLKKNPKIALDRAGSHVEENFIGTIRDLCNGDNQWTTVKHNLSRYEYILRYSENKFYKPQRKRANMGGIPINIDGFGINFLNNPKTISENLFNLMVHNNCSHDVIADFISKLEIIANNCPYRKVNVPSITSNGDILNRLVNLGITPKS